MGVRKAIEGKNDLKTWCLNNGKMSILDEWDYGKNGDYNPVNTAQGSNIKVWWKCCKGHEWKATPNNRTSNNIGCPYCSGRYAITGENDLASQYPDLLSEWDYTKNTVDPTRVKCKSAKKVWWICPKQHEYKAFVYNRVDSESGCPYCANQKVLIGYNDLATKYPNIAKEWDYSKNTFSPTEVVYGSTKKVWWICNKCNCSWKNSIVNRTHNNQSCPKCCEEVRKETYYQAVINRKGSLYDTNRDILAEWDYSKNTIQPTKITAGSNKKVWWVCWKKHSYLRGVQDKVKGIGCPICVREQQSSFPEQSIYFYIKKWFPDAINGDRKIISPLELDIYIPSKNIAIEYDGMLYHKDFERDLMKNERCRKNGIELIRVRDDTCPKIDGAKQYTWQYKDYSALSIIITNILNDLGVTDSEVDIERDTYDILASYMKLNKEKSFAAKYPELLKEWNYNKNGNLDPYTIPFGSHTKVWWLCEKGHEWQASIGGRRNCPYCSNQRILTGYNDLATVFPEVLKEWDYQRNNEIGIDPTKIAPKTKKKVMWICSRGHSYGCTVANKTVGGHGCPYCAKQKLLLGFNDFATCYPDIAKEWDYDKNGDLKPTDCIGGARKVWWKCPEGHSYCSSMNNRASKRRGCPICARKRRVRKT